MLKVQGNNCLTIQTYLFQLCPQIRLARSRAPHSCLVGMVYQLYFSCRVTNTNCQNNNTRINDNNNTVMLIEKENYYKLTFVLCIGSLFFVLIFCVFALHGIQQLLVNFAFPVVIVISWFLVYINVVMIELIVFALHGIQQPVINFACPVVLASSWFLVLIFVVDIKNIGNINKGSIDIFLFESRFVKPKKTV